MRGVAGYLRWSRLRRSPAPHPRSTSSRTRTGSTTSAIDARRLHDGDTADALDGAAHPPSRVSRGTQPSSRRADADAGPAEQLGIGRAGLTSCWGPIRRCSELAPTIAARAARQSVLRPGDRARPRRTRRPAWPARRVHMSVETSPRSACPPTLQATIAARIDRLNPPAKRTLCAAAVIGMRFDDELLASMESILLWRSCCGPS